MSLSHILIIGLFFLLGGLGMSAIQNAMAVMLRALWQKNKICYANKMDMPVHSRAVGKTTWKTST